MDRTALHSLWQQSREQTPATETEWGSQVQAIYACGRGLGETLHYLHNERPALGDFLHWMTDNHPLNEPEPNTDADSDADLLTANDLAFFEQQGYLVLKQAVSSAASADARAAIQIHLGIDPTNSSTWYGDHAHREGLMVQLYQHPALERNRRSARIRKAFEQLYASADIHLVVDKVSFNPPEMAGHYFKGSALHWDVSLAQPIPFKLQGLLYLSDCEADGGAFHCVPAFQHQVGQWLSSLPNDVQPREEAVRTLQPIPIPGRAGDLVIWHQALPHCATANHSPSPRYVQYITYDPDGYCAQPSWI